MKIDQIDRQILKALQENGRLSNAALAEQVGLAATSMSDRVKRLQKSGFITGYHASLDPNLLGFGILVFVEVLLDKSGADGFERFGAAVAKEPRIHECHLIAGGFDYLLKARLPDMASYRTFLGEVIPALPGVRETRSFTVMEEVKRESALPL